MTDGRWILTRHGYSNSHGQRPRARWHLLFIPSNPSNGRLLGTVEDVTEKNVCAQCWTAYRWLMQHWTMLFFFLWVGEAVRGLKPRPQAPGPSHRHRQTDHLLICHCVPGRSIGAWKEQPMRPVAPSKQRNHQPLWPWANFMILACILQSGWRCVVLPVVATHVTCLTTHASVCCYRLHCQNAHKMTHALPFSSFFFLVCSMQRPRLVDDMYNNLLRFRASRIQKKRVVCTYRNTRECNTSVTPHSCCSFCVLRSRHKYSWD